MMRHALLAGLSTLLLAAQTYTDRYRLHDRTITVVTELYNDYGTKGRMASFYDDTNGTHRLLFSLVLDEDEPGCWDNNYQKSTYRITDDAIIAYTLWHRSKIGYHAPEGVRKMRYTFDAKGTLRVEGEIYLETDKPYHEIHKGMRYLITPPKTDEEQKALDAYISMIQKRYKATFITDKSRIETLRREAKEALENSASIRWH